MRHIAHALLLVVLVLPLDRSAWALPITGYLEGTAANGWQGAFAVQLADGSVLSGTSQITGLLNTYQSLSLVTEGCAVGPGCVTIINLATSTDFTMTPRLLNLAGTASLGSLGALSWGSQFLYLLPGDPAPTASVLAIANGTFGGTSLTQSTFSFGFNSTLTASFVSVTGGQALHSLRLDFTDGTAPPTSRTLFREDVSVLINNGVPVALGTPLAAASVPEPSPVALLGLSITGILLWRSVRTSVQLETLLSVVQYLSVFRMPANAIAVVR